MRHLEDRVLDVVRGFDDDNGESEQVYTATVALIEEIINPEAAQVFAKYVDATDGRFYLKSDSLEQCIADMKRTMRQKQDVLVSLVDLAKFHKVSGAELASRAGVYARSTSRRIAEIVGLLLDEGRDPDWIAKLIVPDTK